jgi:hypothetical protein
MNPSQLSFLDLQQAAIQEVTGPHFHGATYSPEHDQIRLTAQHARVMAVMRDEQWHTVRELQERYGIPGTDSAITARLRDFRKETYGSHKMESRRRPGKESSGVWEYRVLWNSKTLPGMVLSEQRKKEAA